MPRRTARYRSHWPSHWIFFSNSVSLFFVLSFGWVHGPSDPCFAPAHRLSSHVWDHQASKSRGDIRAKLPIVPERTSGHVRNVLNIGGDVFPVEGPPAPS